MHDASMFDSIAFGFYQGFSNLLNLTSHGTVILKCSRVLKSMQLHLEDLVPDCEAYKTLSILPRL